MGDREKRRQEAEKAILDGPDCPAKSFLLARMKASQEQQAPPPEPTMADRLAKPLELTGQPIAFEELAEMAEFMLLLLEAEE